MSTSFSQNMKVIDRKNRRVNNHVACHMCGRIVYRSPAQRQQARYTFCSHFCQQRFYHPNIPYHTHKFVDWHQMAVGVSMQIAQALTTGEWK